MQSSITGKGSIIVKTAERRPSLVAALYCTLAALLLVTGFFGGAAQAQTYTVLYTFTGSDGSEPLAGLTMDSAGNLYGTTEYGGARSMGNVFKLTHKSTGWIYTNLYDFQGGTDGEYPEGKVVIAADGTLYGSTNQGGTQGCGYGNGCGTIFRLQPPVRTCPTTECSWNESVIYRFDGTNGAGFPLGDIAIDRQGNIYGTASYTYQLSPSNGVWTLTILSDEYYAAFGVVLDAAGNVYGADLDANAVFELSPTSSGWVGQVLYTLNQRIQGNGLTIPVFDQAGNLYGGASSAGPGGSGTIYQLSPSDGGWTFNLLYGFRGHNNYGGPYESGLLVDPSGTVYGTTWYDGANNVGSVFRLTPTNGEWVYTDLYDFQLPSAGGCFPNDELVRDAAGNLYGTTSFCGSAGDGVVFEVTP